MRTIFISFLVVILVSCQNNQENREKDSEREASKAAGVLKKIDSSWVLVDKAINVTSENNVKTWSDWRLFMQEVGMRPAKNLGSFRKKSKILSEKAIALQGSLPPIFDKPSVKCRLNALITKINMLELYLGLNEIPTKKVTVIVSDINKELISLQRQMGLIEEKSKIIMEEGELEMMMHLRDTTRAIPTTMKPILKEDVK